MLNDLLPRLQERVKTWAEQLLNDRWISQNDFERLVDFDTRQPSALFDGKERPLVVGFFGGTGVGKSSLLNRLAGEKIARTGVERPTSREVTVYLHQSLSIAKLPDAFPTDKVKIALHKNESNQDLLWIDMPDFDSAEQANKAMVLKWLPYIDVLIYVVNPERYKDDQGWRLLLEHGLDHAWIFVINHWDRGVEEQRDDFRKLLAGAGLADPLIFRTDCNPDRTQAVADDFAELESTLQNLASENVIKHLEQRGVNLRIQEMQLRTRRIVKRIGSAESLDKLAGDWQEIWQRAKTDIRTAQQWRIMQLSARYTSAETRWFSTLINAFKGKEKTTGDESKTTVFAEELWDAQIKTISRDSLQQLIHAAKRQGLATGPVKQLLQPLRAEHEKMFSLNLQKCLTEALQLPGSRWQRLLHRTLGYATTLLPLLAMFWVAWKVIVGYYEGEENGQQYLGFDFAIHSGLLIGLAWLVPYYLYQKAKPSLREAAAQGMKKATDETIREFGLLVLEKLELLKKRQHQAIAGSEQLFSGDLLPDRYSGASKQKILSRMLMHG
ncbi:MAG: GTPase domain-containing protein [Gammaproteobacteria bacterium]|nr:GTPase domain-containing protein [Gammaproteobacteria bacterium]